MENSLYARLAQPRLAGDCASLCSTPILKPPVNLHLAKEEEDKMGFLERLFDERRKRKDVAATIFPVQPQQG